MDAPAAFATFGPPAAALPSFTAKVVEVATASSFGFGGGGGGDGSANMPALKIVSISAAAGAGGSDGSFAPRPIFFGKRSVQDVSPGLARDQKRVE